MGNKLAGLLVLLALCVGGYFVWRHYHEQKMEYSGDFTCDGCMTPEQKARFDKEDHGETADGQSEHKTRSAAQEAKSGFPDANAPVNGTPGTQASGAADKQTAPAAMAPPANSAMGPMPATDSQAPNAPNGMRFGGSGTYQWYRQGNLTWRIDTVSGRSCIIYATMEEWQKQIVYSHGCGGSA